MRSAEVVQETVERGVERLDRRLPSLASTGTMGGLDVSVGIFALYIVLHLTEGNLVVGGLAFSVGFIILTVGGSELFTENFLVPIAAVVAGESSWRSLLRLWLGALVFNLLGGWIALLIIMSAFPSLHEVAIDSGQHFVEIGIGWRSFALAMFAGMIITLMTWMESTEGVGIRVLAAVVAGSLLAIGEMNHSIVASIEMFAGIIAGGPYGYLDWLPVLGWAVLGNTVGGIGLVTVLRLVRAHSDEDAG